MNDQDKVTAAAKRLWTIRDGQLKWADLRIVYPRCSADECQDRMAADTMMLANAYLVHPPLTRERVEKAAGELMDGIRGVTGGHEPLDRMWLTDRLCRLLGVEE